MPELTPEKAAAQLVAAVERHVPVDDSFRLAADDWSTGSARSGKRRPDMYLTREGEVDHRVILRRIGTPAMADFLHSAMAIRGLREADASVAALVIAVLDSGTRHCNGDPPPDGATG